MYKKIAVLAGDGIGPEVMQATLSVLNTVAQIYSHQFEYIEAEIGGAAYEKYGVHCPDETLEKCAAADAILFGSVGGSVALQHLPKWKGCEANSILKLRDYFDLNINIRPIKVLPTLKQLSPLNSTVVGEGFDCVIFRELTGGIYFGTHEQVVENAQRVARDESVYSEEKIRQIACHAFNAAKSRGGRLCSVDKANVLATSKLWREVVNEVGSEYPDVELTHMLVDNCAMQLVLNPQQFDVIVTENMFGGICPTKDAPLNFRQFRTVNM